MLTMIAQTGTGQSFLPNVDTYLTFNSVVFNDLGTESNDVANLGLYIYNFPNDGIQIKFSGLYYLASSISLNTSGAATRGNYVFSLWANDETFLLQKEWTAHCLNPISGVDLHLMTVSTYVRLFEGDIIRSRFIHSNNQTLTSGVDQGPGPILSNTQATFNAFLSASLIIQ